MKKGVPGAGHLQDVLQYFIVTLLRDTTHRRVDCFDHQHPVYVDEYFVTRTMHYNQWQHILIVQHLRNSVLLCSIARAVLSVRITPRTKMHVTVQYVAAGLQCTE